MNSEVDATAQRACEGFTQHLRESIRSRVADRGTISGDMLLGHVRNACSYSYQLGIREGRAAQAIEELRGRDRFIAENSLLPALTDDELSALIEACNCVNSRSAPRPPWDRAGLVAHNKLINEERRRGKERAEKVRD